MNLSDKMVCLAAHFAVSAKPASDFNEVVSAAHQAGLQEALKDCLVILDTPRLLRQLARYEPVTPLDWDTVTIRDKEVLWQGNSIGKLQTFYKVAFPQETQARIAYEVFLDRFLSYVQCTFKVVMFHESDADLTFFIPAGATFDLGVAWRAFVNHAFSSIGLRRTFVSLVNSIRLSDRGYSTLSVPVMSEEQALYLAAFYRANLASTEASDAWRQREVNRLRAELGRVQAARDQQRLQKAIAKLEKELETRQNRYGETYQSFKQLKQSHPVWMAQVKAIARREMGELAGRQLSQRGNIVAKYVSEMEALATMRTEDFFHPSPLLTKDPFAFKTRSGGDSGGEMCYACGHVFDRREVKFKANKFIFESPSQRLQSGSGQTEPKVCATCAAISFVSPIKTGTDRLAIRLCRGDDGRHYLLEDQLRMLTLGELNVVAGRYALIRVSEWIRTDRGRVPLPERMGGRQYALYKVASLFSSEVFRRHRVEAIISGTDVLLAGRHLAVIRGLIDVFDLNRRSWWGDKELYGAVGQAVRHIEREEVVFAVYELLKAWRGKGLLYRGRLNIVQAGQLEQLCETHWRWLMEEKPKKATLFRDVAAMTGLLYAFCNFVRQSVEAGKRRIEVRKLIERATEPYGFIYTAAGNTQREMATLYRQSDTYFCFDQAKNLLAELGVDVTEREGTTDKGTPSLVFYFDDVVNAYTHLFETRYRSPKEQRDFTYTLRLSVHARFPELMEREKGE